MSIKKINGRGHICYVVRAGAKVKAAIEPFSPAPVVLKTQGEGLGTQAEIDRGLLQGNPQVETVTTVTDAYIGA